MKALLQRIALLLPLAALAAAPQEKLGFDPQKEPEKAAAAYFAPESLILFRMRYPDGTYREFMRNFDKPNRLRSVGGWVANIKGDRITVKSGRDVDGGPASFVFQKGRLVEFAQGGVKKTFPYEGVERPLAGDVPPYHFGDALDTKEGKTGKASRAKRQRHAIDRKSFKSFTGKWKKSGRLQWPFVLHVLHEASLPSVPWRGAFSRFRFRAGDDGLTRIVPRSCSCAGADGCPAWEDRHAFEMGVGLGRPSGAGRRRMVPHS